MHSSYCDNLSNNILYKLRPALGATGHSLPGNAILAINLLHSSAMANLIRGAKSGNDWTQNELRAYNIQVVEQSLVEFFNQNELPLVSPAVRHFCETTDRTLAPDDDTYKLLHYLDLAQHPKVGQEAAVDNFAARLLETLGYSSGRRIIVTRQALPLIVCGMPCSAQTDVCICDENDYLLLVHGWKIRKIQNRSLSLILSLPISEITSSAMGCIISQLSVRSPFPASRLSEHLPPSTR